MMIDFDTQVISQYAGASHRTADELVSIFIAEAGFLTAGDAAKNRIGNYEVRLDFRIPAYVLAAMEDTDNARGWCTDPENGQVLHDFVSVAEGWLGDNNFYVVWDDGFTIFNTMMWTEDDWTETENW
jgi:hypothetical protein